MEGFHGCEDSNRGLLGRDAQHYTGRHNPEDLDLIWTTFKWGKVRIDYILHICQSVDVNLKQRVFIL